MTTKQFASLLKNRIINDFQLNILFIKSLRTKRSLLMLAVFIYLYLMIVGQLSFYTNQIYSINLASWIPYLTFLLTHIILLYFNALMTYGEFIAFKDIHFLRSLPLSLNNLILTRFAYLYLLEALAVLLISPATLLTWAVLTGHYALAFLWWIGLSVFSPLLAIGISLLISMSAIRISQVFQSSKTAYNGINLLMMLVVSLLPIMRLLRVSQLDYSDLFGPATWLRLARLAYLPIPMSHFKSIFIWILTSLLMIIGALVILYLQFDRLTAPLNNDKSRHQAKVRNKQRLPLWVLIEKEFKLFVSLPIYFTNTAFMIIILPMSLIIFTLLPDYIRQLALVPLEGYSSYIPVIIAGIVSMTNTTTVSLSLEGKHINGLLALPVSASIIYRSKIYFNLLLFMPPTLLSSVLAINILALTGLDLLFVLLVPLIMVVFSSWLGMLLNSYFQNYLWENETQVVKQSIAVLINLLLVLGMSSLACLLISIWGNLANWLFILVLIITTLIIRQHLFQRAIHSI